MNIFDPQFITSVKSQIAKQLTADNGPVTRKTILEQLDTKLDAEQQKEAELAVSLVFRLGLIPEYKMYQKIGIKSSDYVPSRQRKVEVAKRKIHPNNTKD